MGMNLKEYIQRNEIKYSVWAKEAGVPASCIHRHLKGKGYFKPPTARKLAKATGGQVDVVTLCPDLEAQHG